MKPTFAKRLAAIVCTAFVSTVAAAEPLSILGLTIGMSAAQAREKIPKFECLTSKGDVFGDESCRIFGSGSSTVEYGGVMASSLVAYFYDDKLAKVAVRFNEAAFHSIAASLETKFGQPAEQQTKELKNRMGASFENKEMRWKSDTIALAAVQRAGKVNESQVMLSSQDGDSEYARRTDAKAKASAAKM